MKPYAFLVVLIATLVVNAGAVADSTSLSGSWRGTVNTNTVYDVTFLPGSGGNVVSGKLSITWHGSGGQVYHTRSDRPFTGTIAGDHLTMDDGERIYSFKVTGDRLLPELLKREQGGQGFDNVRSYGATGNHLVLELDRVK